MATAISAPTRLQASPALQTGPQLTEEDGKAYLSTRSLNDLVKTGKKATWEQMPPGIKNADAGDVPEGTTITYVRLPPFNGQALFAGIVDYPALRSSEVIVAGLNGPVLAHGEVKGAGRWDKTLQVD